MERAFGVLQSRFHIVSNPARVWNSNKMDIIIKACIILHNMIIADSGFNIAEEYAAPCVDDDTVEEIQDDLELEHGDNSIGAIARELKQIEDKDSHIALEQDLIEHVWNWVGDRDF